MHDGLQQTLVEESKPDIGAHRADDAVEVLGMEDVVNHHFAVHEQRAVLVQLIIDAVQVQRQPALGHHHIGNEIDLELLH